MTKFVKNFEKWLILNFIEIWGIKTYLTLWLIDFGV